MLIPWNTDAPLYHFPFVTIGLIVINVAAFIATLGYLEVDDAENLMLAFGEGLRPHQWLTSIFMHGDIGHLLGNMIFLWGFGLVIEGKLGWWRFLLVYLGLGAFQCAIVQICMLDGRGSALGASGAIYGLLAMSLIWAPRNEMNCLFIALRPVRFDMSILAFVTLFVGWELVEAWLSDFAISSAMLHLAGAVPGFVLATVLLKWGIVDCENWDLFAVFAGREGQAKSRRADPKKQAAKESRLAKEREMALAQFHGYLHGGQPAAALALHQKMEQARGDWKLTQPQLLELIKALHKQEMWSQSVAPMSEYLRHAPDAAPRVRLRLAQILMVHEKRPGRALSVLEKIPAGALNGELQAAHQRIEAQARKMYADGELETDADDV